MQKTHLLYEGKAKKVYATDNDDIVLVDYKDDATAFNGLKKGTITGKGAVNNKVSNIMFALLKKQGIPTHLVKELSDRQTLVKKVDIVPVEVIIRNIAAGSLCKRLGLKEGASLNPTVLEYCYKDDSLGDPMINEYHAYALGIASKQELDKISELSFKINGIMVDFFKKLNIELVDFKLEFGRYKGEIILADEISPDTCRFWDSNTKEKLDKDRFRRDLGGVEQAYTEILNRLTKSEQ